MVIDENGNDALRQFLRDRDDLFRNPTLDKAMKMWYMAGNGPPAKDDVPLASVHKARLQWLEATDAMIFESTQWLIDHGYEVTFKGAPPLTPQQRDADRVTVGKKPLGETQ
jgi:hypothetical protein